jgi:hypothetical protein
MKNADEAFGNGGKHKEISEADQGKLYSKSGKQEMENGFKKKQK